MCFLGSLILADGVSNQGKRGGRAETVIQLGFHNVIQILICQDSLILTS